ncbi:hypothetical protein [uncultured Desulfovibrio sp.]|uniref:hypothetical protein n=1 Tax=uncultured Desulfovibrio sp. TaxID=167968 RepID=UPI00261CE0A0|nr:hypothetical protein [uncultured Desulfovibrio sp.]
MDAKPGEAFTREQHEKFARGFEAWLREGKAPTRNLESAFARFKKWLTRIYRKATELSVELIDDVRDVFSRLLATDMEIEAAARNSGLLDMDAKYLETLGVPEGAERVYASGLMKAARDAGAARLRAARDADRKEQLRHGRKRHGRRLSTIRCIRPCVTCARNRLIWMPCAKVWVMNWRNVSESVCPAG